MNVLKIILVVIVVIIAIPLIAALFIKNDYSIARDITIDKPVPVVYNYVRHLKNQDHFSKWVMTDPGMKKIYKGTDGDVGFVYAWDSQVKEAGKGEQEIITLDDNKKVDIEVRFEKPMASVAHTPFTTIPVSDNQTKVIWELHGKSKYPLNIMNLFMDKMLGKDMDTSLVTLKGILEKS